MKPQDIITTKLEHYAFGYGDKKGCNKLMFWNDAKGYHYTLLFDDRRKQIDLHLTSDKSNEKYHSLLKIKYYTCYRILVPLLHVQAYLVKKYWFTDTVDIRKLIRWNTVILPMENNDAETYLIEKRRPKKYRVKAEVKTMYLNSLFFEPEKIYSLNSNSFAVYSKHDKKLRLLGLITRCENTDCLYYINQTKYNRFGRDMFYAIRQIVGSMSFENKEQLLAIL